MTLRERFLQLLAFDLDPRAGGNWGCACEMVRETEDMRGHDLHLRARWVDFEEVLALADRIEAENQRWNGTPNGGQIVDGNAGEIER